MNKYIEKMSKSGTYAKHIKIVNVSVPYHLKVSLYIVDDTLTRACEICHWKSTRNNVDVSTKNPLSAND